ncbi:MAG: hypothetical protein WBG92_00655 [Thiohalocapsa sp.]
MLAIWPLRQTAGTRYALGLGLVGLLTLVQAPGAGAATIIINPDDDSCVPASTDYDSCASACEADSLGCAEDIHAHIIGPNFKARRVLYPTTEARQPNPITPMHGLFNTIYVNQQANDAIEDVITNPFEPVDLPPWSIVAKENENSKPGDPNTLELWQTSMYKIPGYCPKRAVAAPDSVCVGGEWFWYLFRSGNFLVFDFDPVNGGLPAWGKAEAFCLECHGAVSETDWLWIAHYRRERERQVAEPTRIDDQTPGVRGAGLCKDVRALFPLIPPDVRVDPASLEPAQAQRMFDCYAWKAFVGLNWPASTFYRGLPGFLPFNTPNRDRVWETYAQVYETFQPQDPTWTLKGKHWNSRQPLPEVCRQALDEAPAGTIPRRARAFQVLNESHQAFGNQFNTLVDTNGSQIRYEVRFNRAEWRYLQDQGFADTGSYDYQGPVDASVVLPDNRAGYGRNGAIEIKAAWKELCTDPSCEPLDDPKRYYARPAFIYNQAVTKQNGVQPESCRIAQVGLVGLHTVFKTFWAPQWIWATFEHVDNVPEDLAAVLPDDPPYTLFNPKCLLDPPTPEQCATQRPGVVKTTPEQLLCCVNLQMIPNSHPAPDNPTPFDGILPLEVTIPNQVTRIVEPDATAKDLNRVFQELLKRARSPFQYYKLINTQWPIDGRLGPHAEQPFAVVQKLCLEDDSEPCYKLAPLDPNPSGLRLRNTTMETFQVSLCEPGGASIDSPSDCTPASVAHDPFQVGSGGCMNCHLPSGADASFLWEDAIWERVPLTTEPD